MNKVLLAVLTSSLVLGFMPSAFSSDVPLDENKDMYTGVTVEHYEFKNKDHVIETLEHRCKEVSDFTNRINTESEEMGQEKAFKMYGSNYFGGVAWLAQELAAVLEAQGKDVADLRDLAKEMRRVYREDLGDTQYDEQAKAFEKIPALLERAKEVIEDLKA